MPVRALNKLSFVKIAGLIAAAAFALGALADRAAAQVTHPFLLVTENTDPAGLRPSFADMQSRASSAPWSTMKADAINYVNNTTYDVNAAWSQKHLAIGKIAMAGAIAYMTDPGNKASYKNKVRDALLYWDDARTAYRNYSIGAWTTNVPPGSSLLASIVALDIIYNDLTSTERANIEAMINTAVGQISTNWPTNRLGVKAVWEIYNNGTSSTVAEYRSVLVGEMAADGTTKVSSGYGWARYASMRLAKSLSPHIFEATGQAGDFYSESRFQDFYEWLFIVGMTPLKRPTTFGHTNPSDLSIGGNVNNASSIGMAKYDAGLMPYVRWLFPDINTSYNERDWLFSYILRDSLAPAAKSPRSRVYSSTAGFWEASSEESALMGSLWSITAEASHNFPQTNSVNLTAYGEFLVKNVGYGQISKDLDLNFPWEGYAKTATANSVVQIGEEEHAGNRGGGVTEGFVGGLLDYASANDGPAISNGNHQRSLVMVHPQDGANGYFVVMDEVFANNSSHAIDIRWRPDSEVYATVASGENYKYTINRYSGHDVFANFFLATPPSSVAIEYGAFGNDDDEGPTTYSNDLVPTYYSGASAKNVVTVIYPSDNAHAAASFTRLSGTGYTGASINSGGGIIDYAFESDSAADRSAGGGATFNGLASVYRMRSGASAFYFVRKGTKFNDGALNRRGYDAAADVTVYMRGGEGMIVSPGANVKFYHPGVTGVRINGAAASAVSSGAGYYEVNVPSGTHKIALMTPLKVEAEDMTLTNYTPEDHLDASGGKRIKLNSGSTGNAKFNFAGPSAVYNINVRYFDEDDGPVTMRLYKNGAEIDSWQFSQTTLSYYTRTKMGVSVGYGDEIKVEATYASGEHGRVDYIELVPARVEAEDMALTNYTPEADVNASGGYRIKLNNFTTGDARFSFSGLTGVYDINVRYLDENDGPVTMTLSVNGVQVGSPWQFNQNTQSYYTHTANDVAINSGDEIKVQATYAGGEHARVDYIDIVP